MSHQLIINLHRREYLDPSAVEFAAGALMGLVGGNYAVGGLALLLAASNGKDSGDFYVAADRLIDGNPVTYEPQDDRPAALVEHQRHRVARHIVGRWAGEPIAIIASDDGADGDEIPLSLDQDVAAIEAQQGGWVDISEHVAAVLDLEPDTHQLRHEVHDDGPGAPWTRADGFNFSHPLPRPPRSWLDPDSGAITAIPELPPIDPRSEAPEADGLAAPGVAELEAVLGGATNMLGALRDDVRERVLLAAEHPTQRTWNAASSIILRGTGMVTLWQAVCAVDPTFQAMARRNLVDQTVWERLPTGHTILTAVRLVTRLADDQVAATIHKPLGPRLGNGGDRTAAPLGRPSNRAYRRMGEEKFRACRGELRLGRGEAVDWCRDHGGDPRADLIRVEEIAAERGLADEP